MAQRGELFSSRASTRKRTYFFNIKENRSGDVFLNIVESKKREGATGDGSEFERHSVIVFEEDLRAFVESFDQAVEFVRGRRKRPERRAPARSARTDAETGPMDR